MHAEYNNADAVASQIRNNRKYDTSNTRWRSSVDVSLVVPLYIFGHRALRITHIEMKFWNAHFSAPHTIQHFSRTYCRKKIEYLLPILKAGRGSQLVGSRIHAETRPFFLCYCTRNCWARFGVYHRINRRTHAQKLCSASARFRGRSLGTDQPDFRCRGRRTYTKYARKNSGGKKNGRRRRETFTVARVRLQNERHGGFDGEMKCGRFCDEFAAAAAAATNVDVYIYVHTHTNAGQAPVWMDELDERSATSGHTFDDVGRHETCHT